MQLGNYTLIIIAILIILIVVGMLVLILRRRRKVGNGSGNKQIYIGNLPYRTSDKDLRNQFSQYGRIESVRVVKDRRTNRSKGYAFITYFSSRDAEKSLATHGKKLGGRSLVVYIAKPRR